MGLSSKLESLLFFLELYRICSGFLQENCTNYKLQFERVFSVPGDVAMLSSTLVSPDVFNFTSVPYNITWYESKTGRELSNQPGQILVRGETLWLFNVTQDDDREYITIVRTPTRCYKQTIRLEVNQPDAGKCVRPHKADQTLTNGVNSNLFCPLKDEIKKLDSYNITSSIKWYKDCNLIVDGEDNIIYLEKTKLMIEGVMPHHKGFYTCTLTFTLGGVTGSVSETIDAKVNEDYCLVPEVREPANKIIKAEMGSSFERRCLVFVPGNKCPTISIFIFWFVRDELVFSTDPSDHFYTSETRMWSQDSPIKGVCLERMLMSSKLTEKDFNINYTCQAYSDRENPVGYFTLLPAEPDLILPMGLVFGGVTVLFIISVIVYYLFKVDIVLWFRRAFSIFYTNTDLDGKLYDAYVAYPQNCLDGFNEQVETFALHTLPQVLEKACGYKLFIAGRDCLPGQAIVDSVDNNIQASRRLLLLYNASTFTGKSPTSSVSSYNKNISKKSDGINHNESRTSDNSSMSFDGSDGVYSDMRQQLECVAAMHRALLDASLKVVLVELEKVTPAQLALFPESVRHLRKKQGAVCWWKNQRTRQRWKTCMRREDEEKGGQDAELSPSLSPSSRFWKKMKYHMPVRGKRVVYPEKTALLNL